MHDPHDQEDSDRAAITACQRGDVEGLAVLVRRYERDALRLAWLLTGDRYLAEDIAQDSFIQAYQAIARFDASRPFRPWLRQIVINTARMRARSARRRREVSLAAFAGGDVDAMRKEPHGAPVESVTEAAANPVVRAEWREEQAAIGQALAALTPKQREAVVLRYYAASSDEEIATILGCPVNTARHRIYNGLRALEHVIRQRFAWSLDEQVDAASGRNDAPNSGADHHQRQGVGTR